MEILSMFFRKLLLSLSLGTIFILGTTIFPLFAKHTLPSGSEDADGIAMEEIEPFFDVPETHRNFDAIDTLRQHGLVEGYDDGTFRPGQLVTRAEATAMIIRARDPDNPHPDAGRYKNCFDDVQKQWFAKYACLGKAERWLKGYPGTQLFRPGSNVIVTELLRLTIDGFKIPVQAPINLYKHMWDIPKGYKNEPENFPIVEWWETYMVTARFYQFIDATPLAGKMMSRGEVAEIIYRIMKHKKLL